MLCSHEQWLLNIKRKTFVFLLCTIKNIHYDLCYYHLFMYSRVYLPITHLKKFFNNFFFLFSLFLTSKLRLFRGMIYLTGRYTNKKIEYYIVVSNRMKLRKRFRSRCVFNYASLAVFSRLLYVYCIGNYNFYSSEWNHDPWQNILRSSYIRLYSHKIFKFYVWLLIRLE